MTAKDRFQLLHISLVREYLGLEFLSLPPEPSGSSGAPAYVAPSTAEQRHSSSNMERIIDDFILFCVLVGNDFLPCMPFAEIGEGGLEDFFNVYKEHLETAGAGDAGGGGKSQQQYPWLTHGCGEIVFEH